ncbi:hypothetical protein VM1G_04345 [Cytospora mali]|uniref:Amidoligase enzyme n=1 Tax=Cytospora mali TaxID=578113 RepID=A0A194VXC2_CYTMA|nr:hypothetical protein VM1G_04345 [Valsa mali]
MSSDNYPINDRMLTFGVEFEFLVARPKHIFDPNPQDTRWTVPVYRPSTSNADTGSSTAQDYIASLLTRNGIPALSEHRYKTSYVEYVKEQAVAQGVTPKENHIASHAFWMVSYEHAIHRIREEDLDGYDYVNMEVASRILRETEFDEVARVYHIIKSNIKTLVNSSCGLHYHIGIGHLSLDSLKKLVTLLMVLELKGLFGMICAPYRTTQPEKSPYSQLVYKHSRAALEQGVTGRDSLHHGLLAHLPPDCAMPTPFLLTLTRIWNCQDVQSIRDEILTRGITTDSGYSGIVMRGGFAVRGSSVDLDINGNLVYADPTIEIRYRESTGSAAQDYRWLKLCLSLVRAAEWPQGKFQRTMAALDSTDTLAGLLRSIGIDGEDIQWWSRVAAHYCQHPHPSKKTEFLMPE